MLRNLYENIGELDFLHKHIGVHDLWPILRHCRNDPLKNEAKESWKSLNPGLLLWASSLSGDQST